MEAKMDFTVDPVNFGGLAEYFDELSSSGMKTIIILVCLCLSVLITRFDDPYSMLRECL
jgi:hypothetical protein